MTTPAFELRIGERRGRELPIEVLQSPCGEASATASFPYDDLALESRLKDLQLALLSGASRRRRLVPEYERAVRDFGRDLFESLFVGEVRSLLERSLDHAASRGESLRIELRFESADMASLPWEFLYDPGDDQYLALSTLTPLVRYVDLARPQRPLAVSGPLRVLAMIASPTDLPALDVAQERARIDAALAPLAGRIELEWLDGQTWRDLQGALQRARWHAFHFVGHGGFDATSGEGVIALCDDNGTSHRLGATDLGRLLGDHEPLRLAVLNSCEGARLDRLDIFSSTAAVLVRRGTPAVIAMQYEITDVAAVELSRSFYAAIANGMPVDAALTEARKSVSLALPGTLEWGTPVLYMRSPDGKIFDVDPSARVETPSAPSTADRPRRGIPAISTELLRTRGRVVAGVLAAVIAVGSAVAVAWPGGGSPSGMGTSGHELIGWDGVVTSSIELPEDSVALVEVVAQDNDVDPELAAATSRADARRLERYLDDAGFFLADFGDAFSDYIEGPPGRVVAHTDEGDSGDRERLLVLAPFGGAFDVVVGGAANTYGEIELTVTRHEVDAPEDGEDYIDAILDDERVASFLSDAALDMLSETGMINLPYTGDADDGGDFDPSVFDGWDNSGLLEGLDEGVLECLAEDLSTAFELEPSDEEVFESIGRCSGEATSFTDVVTGQLLADGMWKPGISLSCPTGAAMDPYTVWRCTAEDGFAVWVAVDYDGSWQYDAGYDVYASLEDAVWPEATCTDLANSKIEPFYVHAYWLSYGQPAHLDPDGSGTPCDDGDYAMEAAAAG